MNLIKTSAEPEKLTETAFYFIFSNGSVVIKKKSDTPSPIPRFERALTEKMKLKHLCFLGTIKNISCYCAHMSPVRLPADCQLINLRSFYRQVDPDIRSIAGYARQIHDWNRDFNYCGRCGIKTQKNEHEHARVCAECGLISYPRISPAIIVAVVKEDKILLARGVRFPDKKMFSVLAGFVEPGETLENCVSREIFEEVGIRVNQIRYFNSQSWPFPDSLMIGFTAEYESGSLILDTEEIVEAGWFKKEDLPHVPGEYTLAGELIDWFVQTRG